MSEHPSEHWLILYHCSKRQGSRAACERINNILGVARHKKPTTLPYPVVPLLAATTLLSLRPDPVLGSRHGDLPISGSLEGEALCGRQPPVSAGARRRGRRREGWWLRVRDLGGRCAGGGEKGSVGGSGGGGREKQRSGRSTGRVRRHAGGSGAADLAEEGADGRQVPAATVQRDDTLRRDWPACVQRHSGQSS
ncbi:hypothetical protein PVAP13_1NG196938 [Panicum virgatum]|uniref:Uncharacterized protein n=1 Tax=Panicum virgatum TaxID=38727 RepID=A0A8T0WU85_PANVG|nr:hypothetical protein PVAP13_1NG196938 [Panicum virgatum]